MSLIMPQITRTLAATKAADAAVLHAAKKYLEISVRLTDEEKTGLFLAIKYIEQGQ